MREYRSKRVGRKRGNTVSPVLQCDLSKFTKDTPVGARSNSKDRLNPSTQESTQHEFCKPSLVGSRNHHIPVRLQLDSQHSHCRCPSGYEFPAMVDAP